MRFPIRESVLHIVSTRVLPLNPFHMRTRYYVCQRPQCRLYLRHGAAVLGDEVRVHAQPLRWHGQHFCRPLSRLFVHRNQRPRRWGLFVMLRGWGGGVLNSRDVGGLARRRCREVMARAAEVRGSLP